MSITQEAFRMLLSEKGIPVPMPPQAMNELRLMSPEGILEIPDKTHQVGDKVKIISGLFKGGNSWKSN